MKRTLLIAAALFFTATSARADYCREFTETIRIGGKREQGYGQACMQPDGSWQVVSPARFPSGYVNNAPTQTVIIRDEPRPVIVRIGPSHRHSHRPRHYSKRERYYNGASWWDPRDRYRHGDRWRSRW